MVRPFADFLADIGAPVERGFREVGLPYGALEDLNNYVPSDKFWALLVNMSYSEGIRDLGFRVGEQFGANSPDPKMTVLLGTAPTMYRGLVSASELSNRTISRLHVGILQPKNCAFAHFFNVPSCGPNHPAIEQLAWFSLMILLDMVRAFTGPEWQPTEVGVMTRKRPGVYIREKFARTRMRVSQPYNYVALEKTLLGLPPSRDTDTKQQSSRTRYETLRKDFVGSLTQLLSSYVNEDILSLPFAAELCNVSKRTLQRRLAEAGTCFSEVLDHTRLDAATSLLRNPELTVTDIALNIGYSDVAHFARSFRRMTGVSPLKYRQHLIH